MGNNGQSGGTGRSGSGSGSGNSRKTNTIALGGIFLALTVVCLFGASFMPGVEMTLYAISSLFVGFMVIEKGPKEGVILYAAAVLLGLILVPNKLGLIPFVAFFGYYGVLKFFIEKIRKPAGQVIVKVVFYAVIMVLAVTLIGDMIFGSSLMEEMPVAVICIGGVIMMVVYDLIYTLAIRIYRERVKREKQPKFKLYKEDE